MFLSSFINIEAGIVGSEYLSLRWLNKLLMSFESELLYVQALHTHIGIQIHVHSAEWVKVSVC